MRAVAAPSLAAEGQLAVFGVPDHNCRWPLMAVHQELMLTVDGICLIREGARMSTRSIAKDFAVHHNAVTRLA